MGLTGFDSLQNGHVSMLSLAVTLINLDCKKLIGENTYALAAQSKNSRLKLHSFTRQMNETSREWTFLIPVRVRGAHQFQDSDAEAPYAQRNLGDKVMFRVFVSLHDSKTNNKISMQKAWVFLVWTRVRLPPAPLFSNHPQKTLIYHEYVSVFLF